MIVGVVTRHIHCDHHCSPLMGPGVSSLGITAIISDIINEIISVMTHYNNHLEYNST